MSDSVRDIAPIGASGVANRGGADQWSAPATGTPLEPDAVVQPNEQEIFSRVAQRLVVPRGPVRTVTLLLGVVGSTVPAGNLNSKITFPVLAAPGIIRAIDFQAQLVTIGAAAGLLQLYDNDTNAPLLRTFAVNVGAAGTFVQEYVSATLRVPFLNGILAIWTPLVAAFGSCILCCNIDFESIPIGQKLEQS